MPSLGTILQVAVLLTIAHSAPSIIAPTYGLSAGSFEERSDGCATTSSASMRLATGALVICALVRRFSGIGRPDAWQRVRLVLRTEQAHALSKNRKDLVHEAAELRRMADRDVVAVKACELSNHVCMVFATLSGEPTNGPVSASSVRGRSPARCSCSPGEAMGRSRRHLSSSCFGANLKRLLRGTGHPGRTGGSRATQRTPELCQRTVEVAVCQLDLAFNLTGLRIGIADHGRYPRQDDDALRRAADDFAARPLMSL